MAEIRPTSAFHTAKSQVSDLVQYNPVTLYTVAQLFEFLEAKMECACAKLRSILFSHFLLLYFRSLSLSLITEMSA